MSKSIRPRQTAERVQSSNSRCACAAMNLEPANLQSRRMYRVCGHCDKRVSEKTYKEHCRLYFHDQRWVKDGQFSRAHLLYVYLIPLIRRLVYSIIRMTMFSLLMQVSYNMIRITFLTKSRVFQATIVFPRKASDQ